MDPLLPLWGAFIALFLVAFLVDMNVTNHRKANLGVRVALRWTAVWVALALAFGLALLFFFPLRDGAPANLRTEVFFKFVSGYLTEYSLSIDNLFVFIMIFSLLAVAHHNQPRLLKLGILLSIVLRIGFIVVGMGLLQQFHWLIYLFGALLLWTAFKMAFTDDEDQVEPQKNLLFRAASKVFPLDPDHDNPRFFSRVGGRLAITSVFLVFLVIGSTDVLFAVDSIPAIIGVIKEGTVSLLTLEEENFIAITSNVFAVMGLVSLFFALKGVMGLFHFLKYGVSFILLFIGLKMALGFLPAVEEFFHLYNWLSLAVIVGSLAVSVLLSVVFPKLDDEAEEQDPAL